MKKTSAVVGAAMLLGGGAILIYKTSLVPPTRQIVIKWDYPFSVTNYAFDFESSTNLVNWIKEATITNYAKSNLAATSNMDASKKFFRIGSHWL